MDPKHPLRELRHTRCLTQAQLAEAAGVSLRTLSNIERRHWTPRIDTRRKILQALKIPFEQHVDIFGELP